MKKILVITSIAKPNQCLKFIINKSFKNDVDVIIIGDKKSPKKFSLKNSSFFSLNQQKKLKFKFSNKCPINSYSRKNIGYLIAMKRGANVIYDTDDDNKPMHNFFYYKKKSKVLTIGKSKWINIYSLFSNNLIWPRGFPLDEIKKNKGYKKLKKKVTCPINQRLVDNDPDVDSIYRLIKKIPISFYKKEDIALEKYSWCPFNSQNTVWDKEAFSLMYLPSYTTFRMSDIWRSLIAQRICWENNWRILFSKSTAIQLRNNHNLMSDFKDEIPGYLQNKNIVNYLEQLKLRKGIKNINKNLLKCYQFLNKKNLIDNRELELVRNWLSDIEKIQSSQKV